MLEVATPLKAVAKSAAAVAVDCSATDNAWKVVIPVTVKSSAVTSKPAPMVSISSLLEAKVTFDNAVATAVCAVTTVASSTTAVEYAANAVDAAASSTTAVEYAANAVDAAASSTTAVEYAANAVDAAASSTTAVEYAANAVDAAASSTTAVEYAANAVDAKVAVDADESPLLTNVAVLSAAVDKAEVAVLDAAATVAVLAAAVDKAEVAVLDAAAVLRAEFKLLLASVKEARLVTPKTIESTLLVGVIVSATDPLEMDCNTIAASVEISAAAELKTFPPVKVITCAAALVSLAEAV